MEFRRNASERRRRVLIEENLQEHSATPTAPARSKSQQAPLQRYAEGAQRSHQPHVTDLLPTRRWTLTVLALLGLVAITALVALYGLFYVQPLPVALVEAGAFDLQRVDSLAGWWMAACLAYGSHLAFLIFLVRRHRVDDYRGRYRVWIWLAALLLVASMESVAGMRHVAGELLDQWPPIGRHISPAQCSAILVGLITALAVVRAAIEVRRSWGACAALLLATVGYGLVAIQEAVPWIPSGPFATIVISTSLLLGHYAVLATLVVYARYVYLDAHGCLGGAVVKPERKKRRSAKTEAAGEADDTKASDTRRRTDLERQPSESKKAEKPATEPATSPKKPSATITAAGATSLRVDAAHQPASVGSEGERKMSKAERKKLRRQVPS